MNITNKKGFTFIELLLVVSLSMLLVSVTIPVYGNLQVFTQINESSTQIIQSIRIARENSINRINNSSYGVFFDINTSNKKYILYKGASYASRDVSFDKEYYIEPSLSISTSLIGNEVSFSKSFGIPSNYGEINISNQNGDSINILINEYGITEKN